MSEEEFRNGLPDLDQKQYFSSYEEFNKFMIEIDKELKGIPIAQRQIKGFGEVAERLDATLYLVPNSFARDNDFSNLSLSAHVLNWFDKQYGDRLIVDFANMQTICRVSGDLYKVNIPLVLGKPKLVFTAKVEEIKPNINLGSPNTASLNIGSLIENITNEKLSSITRDEISYLGSRVYDGCLLGNIFFFVHNKDLFTDALADFRMSVDMLFLDKPLYGQSRWHCLQFVEKVIKAFFETNKTKYPRTHDLHKLSELIEDMRIDAQLLDRIQCSASVRYDSSNSSEDECVKSHEAAQEVVLKIMSRLMVRKSP